MINNKIVDKNRYEKIYIMPIWCYNNDEFIELIDSIDMVEDGILYSKVHNEPEDVKLNELLGI